MRTGSILIDRSPQDIDASHSCVATTANASGAVKIPMKQ